MRIGSIVLALAAIVALPPAAQTSEAGGKPERARPASALQALSIYVNPSRGSDNAPGTRARPLKTLTAAWNRIPAGQPLDRPIRIVLAPGRYTPRITPNYWEDRQGTAAAPILITSASRRRRAVLPAANLYEVAHLTFARVAFRDRFDLFHCERCSSVSITRSSLVGSPDRLHENIKVNQSQDFRLTRSRISGAGDNAVDLVAVQGGLIAANRIANAGDWCVYAKGGSADVRITGNVISDCGTGGVTAGQGTGLQFMSEPFIHYEAYRVEITDNDISGVEGAAVGVNGGYQILIAGNRAWDVGSRSHWVEITYGLRSCDGQPGDEGRERCAELLAAGAWGTTRVDDGTNAVWIPNRHVAILGNVIANPRRRGDQLFSVADPYSGASQQGSGLGAVRADDDLEIAGNVIAGRGLPTGLPRAFPGNQTGGAATLFRSPRIGKRLRLAIAAPDWALPDFTDDAPTAAEDAG